MAAVVMYVDTDGSGASTPFASWAAAAQTLEAALEDAACDAGSTIYMQGATVETNSSNVVYTTEGVIGKPVLVIGVANGTVNAPPLVSDYATGAGRPKILTDTTADITFDGTVNGASLDINNLIIESDDRLAVSTIRDIMYYTNCQIVDAAGQFRKGQDSTIYLHKCDSAFSTVRCGQNDNSILNFIGGSVSPTGTSGWFQRAGTARYIINGNGVDFSGATGTVVSAGGDNQGIIKLTDCKVPTSTTLTNSAITGGGDVTLIRCSDTASISNDGWVQDFKYESRHGTVVNATAIVRSASDESDTNSGKFSFKMSPSAGFTLEGTWAALVSPELFVPVDGGSSITCSIYITQATGGTNLTEQDIWIEWLTPAVTDSTQHDHLITENTADSNQRFVGTTDVTVDGTDAWTGDANSAAQKFSITFTPGHEGFVRARVHYAKESGPILYVDPLIEVT